MTCCQPFSASIARVFTYSTTLTDQRIPTQPCEWQVLAENRLEIEMGCECVTGINLFRRRLCFTVTHLPCNLGCGDTTGLLEGGVTLANVITSADWVLLVRANKLI